MPNKWFSKEHRAKLNTPVICYCLKMPHALNKTKKRFKDVNHFWNLLTLSEQHSIPRMDNGVFSSIRWAASWEERRNETDWTSLMTPFLLKENRKISLDNNSYSDSIIIFFHYLQNRFLIIISISFIWNCPTLPNRRMFRQDTICASKALERCIWQPIFCHWNTNCFISVHP